LIQNQFVRWKGHNKWGNIKATKGAKDDAFARLSSRYAMNISIAIKEHGNETNPERNKTLAKYVIILKMTQINFVSRNQLHNIANSCQYLNFGLSWPV
jgi:transcriptional/translational regulatory protein YebC/TACO1